MFEQNVRVARIGVSTHNIYENANEYQSDGTNTPNMHMATSKNLLDTVVGGCCIRSSQMLKTASCLERSNKMVHWYKDEIRLLSPTRVVYGGCGPRHRERSNQQSCR